MSVKSAKNLLSSLSELDCIILDMSLPTFDISEDEDGGRPQGFGGKEIIRTLLRKRMLIPVVVVTAYEVFVTNNNLSDREVTLDELKIELKAYSENLDLEIIKYDAVSDFEWKLKLLSFLQKIINK